MKLYQEKLVVTFLPAKGDTGIHEFKISAADPYNDAVSVTAKINVETNTPPHGDLSSPITVYAGMQDEKTFEVFTDAEDDPLSYSVLLASGAELPAWLEFRSDIRRLCSEALEPNMAPIQLKLLVTDGVNNAVESAFELKFNYVPVYTGSLPFAIEVKPNEIQQ